MPKSKRKPVSLALFAARKSSSGCPQNAMPQDNRTADAPDFSERDQTLPGQESTPAEAGGMPVALVCMSFGLTLLIEIYVIGVLLGGWLDARFHAAPLFTIGGVLAALIGSFYQLYRMLTTGDRRHKSKRGK
jgi:F0F1-type ATP synthase assembly protein I